MTGYECLWRLLFLYCLLVPPVGSLCVDSTTNKLVVATSMSCSQLAKFMGCAYDFSADNSPSTHQVPVGTLLSKICPCACGGSVAPAAAVTLDSDTTRKTGLLRGALAKTCQEKCCETVSAIRFGGLPCEDFTHACEYGTAQKKQAELERDETRETSDADVISGLEMHLAKKPSWFNQKLHDKTTKVEHYDKDLIPKVSGMTSALRIETAQKMCACTNKKCESTDAPSKNEDTIAMVTSTTECCDCNDGKVVPATMTKDLELACDSDPFKKCVLKSYKGSIHCSWLGAGAHVPTRIPTESPHEKDLEDHYVQGQRSRKYAREAAGIDGDSHAKVEVSDQASDEVVEAIFKARHVFPVDDQTEKLVSDSNRKSVIKDTKQIVRLGNEISRGKPGPATMQLRQLQVALRDNALEHASKISAGTAYSVRQVLHCLFAAQRKGLSRGKCKEASHTDAPSNEHKTCCSGSSLEHNRNECDLFKDGKWGGTATFSQCEKACAADIECKFLSVAQKTLIDPLAKGACKGFSRCSYKCDDHSEEARSIVPMKEEGEGRGAASEDDALPAIIKTYLHLIGIARQFKQTSKVAQLEHALKILNQEELVLRPPA